ncbi:hypothetical protein M8J77_003760 [Diaphorina citri]|nr:hypothetical protein M8J77_003760 [Diaphorina citri]
MLSPIVITCLLPVIWSFPTEKCPSWMFDSCSYSEIPYLHPVCAIFQTDNPELLSLGIPKGARFRFDNICHFNYQKCVYPSALQEVKCEVSSTSSREFQPKDSDIHNDEDKDRSMANLLNYIVKNSEEEQDKLSGEDFSLSNEIENEMYNPNTRIENSLKSDEKVPENIWRAMYALQKANKQLFMAKNLRKKVINELDKISLKLNKDDKVNQLSIPYGNDGIGETLFNEKIPSEYARKYQNYRPVENQIPFIPLTSFRFFPASEDHTSVEYKLSNNQEKYDSDGLPLPLNMETTTDKSMEETQSIEQNRNMESEDRKDPDSIVNNEEKIETWSQIGDRMAPMEPFDVFPPRESVLVYTEYVPDTSNHDTTVSDLKTNSVETSTKPTDVITSTENLEEYDMDRIFHYEDLYSRHLFDGHYKTSSEETSTSTVTENITDPEEISEVYETEAYPESSTHVSSTTTETITPDLDDSNMDTVILVYNDSNETNTSEDVKEFTDSEAITDDITTDAAILESTVNDLTQESSKQSIEETTQTEESSTLSNRILDSTEMLMLSTESEVKDLTTLLFDMEEEISNVIIKSNDDISNYHYNSSSTIRNRLSEDTTLKTSVETTSQQPQTTPSYPVPEDTEETMRLINSILSANYYNEDIETDNTEDYNYGGINDFDTSSPYLRGLYSF